MPLLLTPLLVSPPQAAQPLLLFQSSTAQSSLPLLRQLISNALANKSQKSPCRTLLCCFLHHPSDLVDSPISQFQNLEVFDRIGSVPDYDDNWHDPRKEILTTVQKTPSESLNVIIDSVDTLSSDIGSVSETYKFLRELISLIRTHSNPSRLILHTLSPSQLVPLLIQPAFSTSLTHITAHSPAILTHLATAYLTLPPPASPPAKFWGVFLPVSERVYENDRLAFGPKGEGSGGVGEIVVEVLVRGGEGLGRRRGVERVLEGWSRDNGGPCELTALGTLKNLPAMKSVEEPAPDPTQNVSFNLNLTPAQQQSRAQVPLPYAHEGKPQDNQKSSLPSAAIFYDPDSADDIDDDDPDEDLDI